MNPCNLLATNRFSRGGGFTLVELMLALALSLFLIGGVILIYASGTASTREANEFSRVQENIRFASDFMTRDIRNAGYRDRMGLTIVDATEIDEDFARINDDRDILTIRYAGQGSCSDDFDDEFLIVENEYSADGDLKCNGETLVSGVSNARFEFICPNAPDDSCSCNVADLDKLEQACIGVRINLEFEGLRGFDGVQEDLDIELVAAFRNVILSRINFLEDLEAL